MGLAVCIRCRSVAPTEGRCSFCRGEAIDPQTAASWADQPAPAVLAARSLACPDLAGRGVARKLRTVVYSPISGEEALAWELELRDRDGEVVLRMSDLAPFEVADSDGVCLHVSGLFVWARPPETPAKVLPGALEGFTAMLDPRGALAEVSAFEELVLPGDEIVVRAFDLSRGVAGVGYRDAKVVRCVSGEPGAPMGLLRAARAT